MTKAKPAATAAKDSEAEAPALGSIVHAFHAQPIDGEGDGGVAAIVVKVNDDGSLNLRCFAPNGGADPFVTGVRRKSDVEAMEDGPDKTRLWPAPGSGDRLSLA